MLLEGKCRSNGTFLTNVVFLFLSNRCLSLFPVPAIWLEAVSAAPFSSRKALGTSAGQPAVRSPGGFCQLNGHGQDVGFRHLG
jgi:hypothetical protein